MLSTSFGPFPGVGSPDWFMKLNKASIRVNKEFSMSISPVVRKFVNTNQFNLTNSEFIDPNNFDSQLNVSIGNMSTNIYKNGEAPLYILDLHYDQTHPDIISRLFNGKEVIFTRENQDFLMYLAQTLKIKGLKRSLENFIKFGESQTVKNLQEIGRLISEFNEETFDDVYNFLLKYLQSDDENAVRQSYFVAFVIFNGCVARPAQMELFVKLAQKLDVINEFTAVCIYNYKNKQNLQESLFLLRYLYAIAQEEENQTIQNKSNPIPIEKKSLLFSDLCYTRKEHTDPKENESFNDNNSDNEDNDKGKKISMFQIFSQSFTPIQLSAFDLHKEYAAEGVNPDPIAKAIRKDDVSIFTGESKPNHVNFSTYCIRPSLYERSSIINNSNEEVDDGDPLLKRGIKYTGVPLVCYAAYFGSIECFKYLVDEINVEIPSNLTRYAVCGGNSEIISFCQKRMRSLHDEENNTIDSETLLDSLFGSPAKNQEENPNADTKDLENENKNPEEEENKNPEEEENKNPEEENKATEEENENEDHGSSEENNVCVFDSRCLELATIFQRFEAFKFLVEILQLPITDEVITIAIKHFSFEIFVYILSKPGFDLNALFLRSAKFSNEEAASLLSEFCDSYGLQEEDTCKTPLHYACEHGLAKVVKILIEKVKPNLKLKVKYEKEESQIQEEEEKTEANNQEEPQIEEEEEEGEFVQSQNEGQHEEEEGFPEVKTREVRFQEDQMEQHEFDQEVQRGLVSQTSSEYTIPTQNSNENENRDLHLDQEQHGELDQIIQQQQEFEHQIDDQIDQVEHQIDQVEQQEAIIDHQIEEQNEQIQQDEPQTLQEEPQTLQEEPQTLQDEPQTLQEEPQTLQEEPQTLQEEPQTLQEEPQTLQEEPQTLQEEPQTLQEEPQTLQEEPQTLQEEPEGEPQTLQEEPPELQGSQQIEQIDQQEEQIEQQIEQIDQQEEQINQQLQQQEEQIQQFEQQEAPQPFENQQEEEELANVQTREVQIPLDAPQIEEEEEEATEITIDELAEQQKQQQQEQQQEQPEPAAASQNENINERTEDEDEDENDPNHPLSANEEEEVNPIVDIDIQDENFLIKNNSLIEGNNELDELESHPEEEEQPLITFSPSTTDDDEEEFINNISEVVAPTASRVQITERNINLNASSQALSRSVIINPSLTIDFNAKDTYNVTPLQLACKEGWTDIVHMFTQLDLNDIEYDAVSDFEKTALQFAEEAGHADIVKLLGVVLAGKENAENEPEEEEVHIELIEQ
ncbi:hypothetical protein M9Y10_019218 [Tritrichomonas musculus]|uniref:DUF3447 domain-containing protein n=1 Tax=Tritrichomonas musculus TaxID=1915356 RepID=A0ABR2HKL2_9EUKA